MKMRIYLQFHGELIVVHFIYGINSNRSVCYPSFGKALRKSRIPNEITWKWLTFSPMAIDTRGKVRKKINAEQNVTHWIANAQWKTMKWANSEHVAALIPVAKGGMCDMMWLIMFHTVSLDENLHIDWGNKNGDCQWAFFLFSLSLSLNSLLFGVYYGCAHINIRSNERKKGNRIKKQKQATSR